MLLTLETKYLTYKCNQKDVEYFKFAFEVVKEKILKYDLIQCVLIFDDFNIVISKNTQFEESYNRLLQYIKYREEQNK